MCADTPCAHKQTAITIVPAEVLHPFCSQEIHPPSICMRACVRACACVHVRAHACTAASISLESGRPKAAAKALGFISASPVIIRRTHTHHLPLGAGVILLRSGGIRLPPPESTSVTLSSTITRMWELHEATDSIKTPRWGRIPPCLLGKTSFWRWSVGHW